MVVGVAVQVVAVDSQSTGHHHTLNRAPAAVLGDRGAAVVSIRFPEKRRQRGTFIYPALHCVLALMQGPRALSVELV